MKRYLSILLLVIVTLPACEEALEEQALDFIESGNFYRNEEDMIAAVNGVYDGYSDASLFGRRLPTMVELAADVATIHRNPTFLALDQFSYAPNQEHIGIVWNGFYTVINRANTVIDQAKAIPEDILSTSSRDPILAEAYFLRALAYFYLVRLYGDVPLQQSETIGLNAVSLPRTPASTVYESIIEDAQFAEASLSISPEGVNYGRASSLAATTLLADVYLTLEDWEMAAFKAQQVIEASVHALQPNFPNVFSISNEANNPEDIFSIRYLTNLSGTFWPAWLHAGNNINSSAGFQVVQVDTELRLWKEWDERDLRRDFSVYTTYLSDNGDTLNVLTQNRPYPAFGKFNDPAANAGSGSHGSDFPVYRYSEVLLIKAEALSMINGGPTSEAYEAINQVRRRAYGLPIEEPTTVDLSGLDATSFRQAVLDERMFEFVAEAKRWFDLVRSGTLETELQAIGKAVQPYHRLFPVPQAEIMANSEISANDQNTGY